jgi:hypothetical protein
MTKINVLKKDQTLFNELMPNNTLTHYFKDKNNSIRLAIFNNKHFIVIETPETKNFFMDHVMKYAPNMYKINDIIEKKNKKNVITSSIIIGEIILNNN